MSAKPTCGPLYKAGLEHYAGSDPDKIRLFAAGFISGQAEKVYLGACRGAMFRPSPDWAARLLEIVRDVAARYGLIVRLAARQNREIWLLRDEAAVALLEEAEELGVPVERFHLLRGALVGVPTEEIDLLFHERAGHGERCEPAAPPEVKP